ncbi:hypothetical protein LCGC14_0659140 [marine sediment metagenome]|uniref:Uncharacterized protein n=1 Tax=marine sediment metagenome TaxID=412755 RepID=A0A0F9U2E9_9ZZZZ
MSLLIANRNKQKYVVPSPEVAKLQLERNGFKIMYGVLSDKTLNKKERKEALGVIRVSLPDFEDTQGAGKEVDDAFGARIEAAEKDWASGRVAFYYRYPSNPEINALMLGHSINGEYDPQIFTKEKQDLDKFRIFIYESAVLFLVGWEGVATEEDGKEKPLEFTATNTGYIPESVMMGFSNEVMIPYISGVTNSGTGARSNAVPN